MKSSVLSSTMGPGIKVDPAFAHLEDSQEATAVSA